MTLATYLPLPVLTLIGDASVEALALAGATFDLAAMPPWVAYLLPALGWFLLSTVVAELNDRVRKMDAEGTPVSPRHRFVLSLLNRIVANHDKAAQQAAAAKAPEVKP